jgi:deoxyribodipyrimidine photo-lyase
VLWYFPSAGSEEVIHLNETLQKLSHCAKTVELQPFAPDTIIAENELPFSLNDLPNTFTSFEKKIERQPYNSYAFSDYPGDLPSHDSPGRQRLNDYIFKDKNILNYKITRNVLGPGDYSSRLSKWLSAGTIHAAEMGSAILSFKKQYTKSESTYWLLFELLWRDYYFFLHKRIENPLFSPTGIKKGVAQD